jgi:hypothetical protein
MVQRMGLIEASVGDHGAALLLPRNLSGPPHCRGAIGNDEERSSGGCTPGSSFWAIA